jgi:hypothetical protein
MSLPSISTSILDETDAMSPQGNPDANNMGALIGGIVGGVLGCLLLTAAIAAAIVFLRRRQARDEPTQLNELPTATQRSSEYGAVSVERRTVPQAHTRNYHQVKLITMQWIRHWRREAITIAD